MDNPHDPPKSASHRKRPPRRAAFQVGTTERHLVEIFLSLWGTEVYVVDGDEVLRLTSWSIRSVRQFDVGDTEKHSIKVKLDAFPSWKSLITPNWTAEVYVDNELVVTDLFPGMRRRLKAISRVLNYTLLIVLGVAIGILDGLLMLLAFLRFLDLVWFSQ